jgi:D-alanine-D-alanine ligase
VRVGILFDGASAFATKPDMLILGTVEAIEQALSVEGNEVVRIPVHTDGKWIEKIRRARLDLAFNMCEGIDGVSALEPAVIGVLDLFQIPYTGSPAHATALSLRKHIVNALLDKLGLPIPPFAVVRRGSPMPSIGFPAICKPAAEDASLGVEQRSVVRNSRELARRIEAMLDLWDDILVQRFIDGREVNVGVLGDTVLPIAEIDFEAMPRGKWRIITYRSKWETGSDEDLGAIPRCPAKLPVKLANECRRVALAAWKAVGGTGYGRVDMRIDADGRPWILEVNTNPDIAPDAGLARMARVAGMEYAALIRAICEHGLTRPIAPPDTALRWATMESLSGLAGASVALDLFTTESA